MDHHGWYEVTDRASNSPGCPTDRNQGTMGFSVSGATAVILVGLLIGVGIAYPTLAGSLEIVTDARDDRADRMADRQNSDIDIVTATYDGNVLTVEVDNDGTITLSVNSTDVLVDGEYKTEGNAAIDGVGSTDLWQPGERLEYTVSLDNQPQSVKVVAETGVADRTEVQ